MSVDDLQELVENAPALYGSFEIPKPTGGFRTIRPPKRPLRIAQRKLLDALQSRVHFPRWMMGGVARRSIFTHARPHVGQDLVATFDVQKFFPSTSPSMVAKVLVRLGIHGAALDAAVQLVTRGNELPQGAPTSSILANLAIEPADRRIDSLCRKHGMQFTRFVDDIAVSGGRNLLGMKGVFVEAVEGCGYSIAPEKVHFMDRSVAQIVTKLCVNDKLRPTREFIQEVDDLIWLCLERGAAIAAVSEGVTVGQLKNSLTGKIGHINQADPTWAQKLKRRLFNVNWKRAPVEQIASL